jgi:hypothetical protein
MDKAEFENKELWGTSENAVFRQIWMALIVSVLLWICRTFDGTTTSTYQTEGLAMIKPDDSDWTMRRHITARY